MLYWDILSRLWYYWYLAKSPFLVGRFKMFEGRALTWCSPPRHVLRVLSLTCQASARARFTVETASHRQSSQQDELRPACRKEWPYCVSWRPMRMSCMIFMKQEKTQPALREPIANSIQFEHDDMNSKMPQICVCVCVMPAQLSQQALPPSGACVCVRVCVCLCVCACVCVCVHPASTGHG